MEKHDEEVKESEEADKDVVQADPVVMPDEEDKTVDELPQSPPTEDQQVYQDPQPEDDSNIIPATDTKEENDPLADLEDDDPLAALNASDDSDIVLEDGWDDKPEEEKWDEPEEAQEKEPEP